MPVRDPVINNPTIPLKDIINDKNKLCLKKSFIYKIYADKKKPR